MSRNVACFFANNVRTITHSVLCVPKGVSADRVPSSTGVDVVFKVGCAHIIQRIRSLRSVPVHKRGVGREVVSSCSTPEAHVPVQGGRRFCRRGSVKVLALAVIATPPGVARLTLWQTVTGVARRALGGIVRWAIGPGGASSAGARADFCRTDTVPRGSRRRRFVLRTRARGPRWACAVAQVPASCARRALGVVVRWAIDPLGASSSRARACSQSARISSAREVPHIT